MDADQAESQPPKQMTINERKLAASFVFWLLAGIFFIAVDQMSKYLAAARAFRNFYFAFSLPVPPAIMYAIYAAALILIVRHIVVSWKNFSNPTRLAWTLILSGALSNIVERIILGYVRDFIYILTGVFNTADGMIIAGIAILLLGQRKIK